MSTPVRLLAVVVALLLVALVVEDFLVVQRLDHVYQATQATCKRVDDLARATHGGFALPSYCG